MTNGENLFNNLLVISILGGMVIIIYLKLTKKTLLDLIRELRMGFSEDINYYDE
jgi:hypothetical protein